VTLGAAITAFLVWDPALLPHDYGVSASWILRAVSPNGWELWRWFPSWVNVSARPVAVNLAWLVIVASLAAFLLRDAWLRVLPERRSAPFQPAWAASTASVLALLILALMVATSPITDRYQGAEISPGLQAWTIVARPEVAWPEAGGVWASPGPRRNVVFTTADPIVRASVMARTLVRANVSLAVGAWRATDSLSPGAPLAASIAPGSGHAWRGRRAYRGWVMADDGIPPARAEGGEDWRNLGAFMQVVRRPDDDP
jgi:hypothetical protein